MKRNSSKSYQKRMNSLNLLTSSYDYTLPKELIATTPAKPADSARLLVYNRNTKEIKHTVFRELVEYIPSNCALFLNDTKVIKARVFGKKSSGGRVELLLVKPLPRNNFIAMIRGRVKVDNLLEFDLGLKAVVKELLSDGSRVVKFYKNSKELDFKELISILDSIGHTPLPPYINREDNIDDEEDYQTIFAKNEGSVAAPTASLHFTHRLLEEIKSRFPTYYLTLHVGAGTFKPVEVEDIRKHSMHSEIYNIPQDAQNIIDSNKEILAIGTTATRTIEYYARVKRASGECDLFLHPNNPPARVNYLLTNFHLPKSTLIMLVSSFLGRDETLRVYNEAIKNRYRFYSYGDAMLII